MSILGILKGVLAPAPRVSPADALGRLRGGRAVLVDVREPGEWSEGVAEGALCLPLSDLKGARRAWGPVLAKVAGRELLLYCKSGVRSAVAARLLRAEGCAAADAGTLAGWAAAGWRIEMRGANAHTGGPRAPVVPQASPDKDRENEHWQY